MRWFKVLYISGEGVLARRRQRGPVDFWLGAFAAWLVGGRWVGVRHKPCFCSSPCSPGGTRSKQQLEASMGAFSGMRAQVVQGSTLGRGVGGPVSRPRLRVTRVPGSSWFSLWAPCGAWNGECFVLGSGGGSNFWWARLPCKIWRLSCLFLCCFTEQSLPRATLWWQNAYWLKHACVFFSTTLMSKT